MSAHPPYDRLQLEVVRLTEELRTIASRFDGLALPLNGDGRAAMTESLIDVGARGPIVACVRRPRPPLPDPRLVRRIIRQRRLRDRYFEGELFADPGWDILLDLTAARAEHRRVSVTSLCMAAAVPPTTALRWITMMTRTGILVREQDDEDKRRSYIALSDSAAESIARYFDELGRDAARLI